MNLRMLTMSLIACFSMTVSACAETPRPIKKGENSLYYGNITTGQKFGIRIGQSRQSAKEILIEKKIEYYGEQKCEDLTHRKIDCIRGDTFDVYRKYGTFLLVSGGLIYVFYEDDKVTGIAWAFSYMIDL